MFWQCKSQSSVCCYGGHFTALGDRAFTQMSPGLSKLFHTRGPADSKTSVAESGVHVLCRMMSGDDDDHAQRRVECRHCVSVRSLTVSAFVRWSMTRCRIFTTYSVVQLARLSLLKEPMLRCSTLTLVRPLCHAVCLSVCHAVGLRHCAVLTLCRVVADVLCLSVCWSQL